MADAAAEALVANGFAGRSSVVARDVRRVHADPQPGGRPADLEERADLVIFEVGRCPGPGAGLSCGPLRKPQCQATLRRLPCCSQDISVTGCHARTACTEQAWPATTLCAHGTGV